MNDDAIRELFGQVPYWADNPIREYRPIEDYAQDFITESYWSSSASVNLGELRGMTQRPEGCHSWRQLISSEGKWSRREKVGSPGSYPAVRSCGVSFWRAIRIPVPVTLQREPGSTENLCR